MLIHFVFVFFVAVAKVQDAAFFYVKEHAPVFAPILEFVYDLLHFRGCLIICDHFSHLGVVRKLANDALLVVDTIVYVIDVNEEENWPEN